MKAIINASPLIFLAKLDLLRSLELYEEIYTTNLVLDEIKKGMERGFEEALQIMRLVEDKKIVAVDVELSIDKSFGLHEGELSVIQLAKDLKINVIIVDDRAASKVAKYFGLRPLSTPYVLISNVKQGKLSKKDFRLAMDRLISFHYFISSALYQKILELIEKF